MYTIEFYYATQFNLNNKTERYETHYITFEDMWLFYEKYVKPKIWLCGNYIEFYVYQSDIDDMPTSGACDYVIEQMANKLYIQNQLADKQDKMVKELSEYGAWGESELQDKQANIHRLLWVMISDYKEQLLLSEGE